MPDSSASAVKKMRIPFLDEARGAALVLMVVYHLMYDLIAIYGVFTRAEGNLWLEACGMAARLGFLFIAGMSCALSSNNYRRGAEIFAWGLVITLVTALSMPDELIVFGVLSCIGACAAIYALAAPVLRRISPAVGLILFLLLWAISYRVPEGLMLGFRLPAALYSTSFLFPLGFPGPDFYSADYFPLLPWLFLFLSGTYAGRVAAAGRAPSFFYRSHVPPLAAVGRRSKWIYLVHQPVLVGLLWLLFRLIS